MKNTYYAIIDGKETKLRTSTHEYHYSTKNGGMMAKTKEELIKRIHTYCYDSYNWATRHSRVKRTKQQIEKIRIECEEEFSRYVENIVEVYTKVTA